MAIANTPKISGKAPSTKPMDITDFKRGYNSFLNNVRRPINSLDKSINMMLAQDGIVTKRWGTKAYGEALPGEVNDGWDRFSKYNKDTRKIENWLIGASDGQIYVSRTGRDWQQVPGETMEVGREIRFLNIENKVFMANGYNALTFYDIEENEIKRYTKVNQPAKPTVTRQGSLTDGNITLHYRISAVNDVGETVASTAGTVKVNKQRDTWVNDGSKVESVKLDWTAITGAARYNIYYSDEAGQEVYIDSIAAATYTDDARTAPNIAIAAPLDDTTGGPTVNSLAYSDNRIFAMGDPNNPYRVYFGGVGANTTAFSPFYGGGWVDIAKGGPEIPTVIHGFRDGKGENNNTLFMADSSSEGSQYQITLSAMTVGTTSFIVPIVGRVVGSLGTAARNGVVECKNNIFYPSINSFNTTGAKPEMLNVLSTDEVSLAIRPDVRKIGAANARNIATIYFDGKIFWAVTNGGRVNNEIWVLDTELSAWMLPWKLPAKYFLTHTDDNGTEHLLFVPSHSDDPRFPSGGLVEISKAFKDDNGMPFETHLSTGLITFDSAHITFAKVRKIYLEFLDCAGEIDVAVKGAMKNGPWQTQKTLQLSEPRGYAGFDFQLWNGFLWDTAPTMPTVVIPETKKKVLRIRKKLNNLKIEIRSKSSSDYTLGAISVQSQAKKVSDPSDWKE